MRTELRHLYIWLFRRNQYKEVIEFERLFLKCKRFPRYQLANFRFQGLKFHVPDALSFIWQIKDYFVDENYFFLSNSDCPVIYDCGGNVGVATIYFKKMFPNAKIKTFEADSNIAMYLRKNLVDNNFLHGVEIIEKAVWSHKGEINFGSDGADSGSVLLSKNVTKVKCVRLKELLQNETKVDFLKMDIEGAETEVILDCGDALSVVSNLFIEFHSFSDKKQELDKILSVLSEQKFRYSLVCSSSLGKDIYINNQESKRDVEMLVNIYAINEALSQ